MSGVAVNPSTARRLACLLIEGLEQTFPSAVAELRSNPLSAVLDWPDVSVALFDVDAERRTGGRCSVFGFYLEDHTPPLIRIARVPSSGMMNFTCLHELAHHLQPDHEAVADELLRLDGDDRRLEDRVCDAFAAEILLPDEVVAGSGIDERLGPTARQVVAMFEASPASRAATCVRAAQLLRHEGWVLVADDAGVIQFAAAAHHPYRLAPGTPQPEGSLLVDAGRVGSAEGLGQLTYPRGTTTPHYNTDALRHDGYVFAVMSLGATPWNPQPVPGQFRQPGGVPVVCTQPGCGHEWNAWEKACRRCDQHRCPECRRCACSAPVERRVCPGCFIERSPLEFPDGAETCEYCGG